MGSAKNKENDVKRTSKTPESVTDLEKRRTDDEAVRHAVTAEDGEKSVLPGPPIPPDVQAGIREASGTQSKQQNNNERGGSGMVNPSDIKEHMEVVGSDGDHVGTVDRCEGNTLKLTKNDPAADGQHHYIPLAWVNAVDQRVHLAHPGSEARAQWG